MRGFRFRSSIKKWPEDVLASGRRLQLLVAREKKPLVPRVGLDWSQIDQAFIRAECERSHFFEIDLGSIQPGSLQEVVWDRSKIDLHCSGLSENANTSWKRSSLVAFPHWESRKPIAREESWFCKLQKNVCKKGERWRKELLSLLGVTVGFTIT